MPLIKQINKLIYNYNYRINNIAGKSSLNNEAFERGYDAGYIQALTAVKQDLVELKEFGMRKIDRLSIITENDDDDI
jgi:hypothetical protein